MLAWQRSPDGDDDAAALLDALPDATEGGTSTG
jgi:hypothetical protein